MLRFVCRLYPADFPPALVEDMRVVAEREYRLLRARRGRWQAAAFVGRTLVAIVAEAVRQHIHSDRLHGDASRHRRSRPSQPQAKSGSRRGVLRGADGGKSRPPPRGSGFETLARDVHYAARSLRRAPGFTAAVIATLALGIGANTAIFSLVDATFLRPLPFPDADRLVEIWRLRNLERRTWVYPTVEELRRWESLVDSLERVEIWSYSGGGYVRSPNVAVGSESGTVGANRLAVSPGFLAALGIRPRAGRLLVADDAGADATPVVVMAEEIWRRHFGADPTIVGRTLPIDGVGHTVVGVIPKPARWDSDLYTPLTPTASVAAASRVWGIAWLKPGVSIDTANAELRAVSERRDENGDRVAAEMEPPGSPLASTQRFALLAMLGAVFLVLAIACANVANLMLARGSARRGELALRSALGASRSRIARLLLTESLLLGLGGAALGVPVAYWVLRLLLVLEPNPQWRTPLEAAGIDGMVLGYAMLIGALTGVAFGLAPALRGSEARHQEILKSDSVGGGKRRGLRDLLIVAETALSLLLLIAAALAVRGFVQLRFAERGFDAGRILSMRVDLPESRYPDAAARDAFFEVLEAEAARLPGVTAVSLGYGAVPPDGFGVPGDLVIDGRTDESPQEAVTRVSFVDPYYFDLMGMSMLAGRDFEPADLRDPGAGDRPVVVNLAMARGLWPQGDALGARFRIDGWRGDRWHRVVGIASNAGGWGVPITPDCDRCPGILYLPLEPERRYTQLLMRMADGASPPIAELRAAIERLDPVVPTDGLEIATQDYLDFIAEPRTRAAVFGGFGGLAVALAALGVFGVVSYAVSQRTREMGIRMALGARAAQVRRLVLMQSMVPVLGGIVLGIGAALAAGRVITGFLYGFDVAPTDPATFVLAAAVLALVAAAASWIPARRATCVDPVSALRSE